MTGLALAKLTSCKLLHFATNYYLLLELIRIVAKMSHTTDYTNQRFHIAINWNLNPLFTTQIIA